MIIEELLVSLGFELEKKDLDDIKKFEKGIKESTKLFAKLTAVTVGGTGALIGFVKWVSNSVDMLGKQARILGLEAQRLDELRFALEITAGSAQGMDEALESLSRNISEASRGTGSAVEIFGLLGTEVIDAEGKLKKVDEVLLEVFKKTKDLEAVQRIEYLDKLGLGNLNLTSRDLGIFTSALEEAASLSVVTPEDVKKAEDFNDAVSKGLRVLKEFGILIASTVSPVLKQLVDSFKDWVGVNKDMLQQEVGDTFKTIAKFVGLLVSFMMKLFILGVKVVRMVGGLNTVLKVTLFILGLISAFAIGKFLISAIGLMGKLVGLLTLANAQLVLIPIIIGGLIAIIVLAIDELITFAQGGETLFTKLFAKFPVLRDTVEGVLANIMIAWDSFVKVLTDPFSLDNWKNFFLGIVGLFGESIDTMKQQIDTVINNFRDGLIEAGIISGKTSVEMRVDELRSIGAGGAPAIPGSAERLPPQVMSRSELNEMRKVIHSSNNAGAQSMNTIQKSGSAGTNSNINTTQKITVEIKGDAAGLDKKLLGEEIKKAAEGQNREALRNIETRLKK